MSPLLRFLAVNLGGGFVLGLATGLGYMALHPGVDLVLRDPLGAAMLLWSFAAAFAVGAVGTGLGLLPYD